MSEYLKESWHLSASASMPSPDPQMMATLGLCCVWDSSQSAVLW